MTEAALKKPSRSRERYALRVRKGGFDVADASTSGRLRAKSYRIGDLVFAQITKPRNPLFHRLVHRFGTLLANNLDEFQGVDAHTVLKRLQVEGNIGCDEMAVDILTVWPVVVDWVRANLGAPFATVLSSALEALHAGAAKVPVRIPRSLSFESMDEGEFSAMFKAFANYVSAKYWPELTAEQIIEMARAMPEEET